MNWSTFHRESERFASKAEVALRKEDAEMAKSLYQKAAEAEQQSLEYLNPSTKARTLGICVVSAAALWYKSSQASVAERFISHWLGKEELPEFAKKDLKVLLKTIKESDKNRDHRQTAIHHSHPKRPSLKPISTRANRLKILA